MTTHGKLLETPKAPSRAALQRAIDLLGAVDLGDGRYASYDKTRKRWFVYEDCAAFVSNHGGTCHDLPQWWSPKRRYKCAQCGRVCAKAKVRALGMTEFGCCSCGPECDPITADLDTGAEIPA